MRIKVDLEKCTGCRLCEAVCSAVSNKNGDIGIINPQKSAIRIKYDFISRKDVAAVCYQCNKPHCMENCSTHALFRNNGVIKFNPNLCTGCNDCINACPFDLIWSLPLEGSVVKCDLCANYDVQYCVQSCPVEAISVITKKEIKNKTISR